MNVLTGITNIVMATATGVIAVFAISNFCLAKSIKRKTEEREQETKDLLQALVLAQLCRAYGNETVDMGINRFKKYYGGKTQIFK